MSSSKFRDLSSGTKSLIIIEQIFFAGALLLVVHFNELLQVVPYEVISNNTLLPYAVIFAAA